MRRLKSLQTYESNPKLYLNGGMYASRFGHTEIVKLLIEAGADVKAQDNIGYTALIWADLYEYTEVAELLREAGAE